MIVVLDASVTIARAHPDENSQLILDLFRMVADDGAWAPPLWKIEVANVLQMQVRRRRYDADVRDRYLQYVASLNVTIDLTSPDCVWTTTIGLAHRHNLTVYDAIYLELALRRGLPLATLDRDLRAAAEREGVSLLGL